jgi:NNP family nitrate/nitrite transporter-like MFS transporter
MTLSLSWFAFSPLIPEAVKNDLKLTSQQIGMCPPYIAGSLVSEFTQGNSNIVSLCATLIVRLIVGPLVDRQLAWSSLSCRY